VRHDGERIMIGNRAVGPSEPPLVIAEMSGNHNQSVRRALEIVDAAAEAGAHGIKLQTYTADTMTLDFAEGAFFIDDPNSLWRGRTLYDLYQEAHTPWDWHEPILERCRERGVLFFSTPFDATAVEFLESLNVPAYKIASFENTDLALIRKVAATGKPMIMSTGMATLAELDEAVGAARETGCRDLILLKCTSTYPATADNTNIVTIPHMRQLFGCQVGLSDHTMGVGVAVAGVALGATVIEKHFTINRAAGGVDAAFSIEPGEMKALVQETKSAWQALGTVRYGPTEAERGSLRFRRSLYVVKDMKAGDIFTQDNVRVIRPGFGLPPKYYATLMGISVGRDVRRGTPLTWDLLASRHPFD
jgi:N-acetylneuraminate synthase